MSTRLILIRHGLTDWNLSKRYCGSSNTGLNKKGRSQAESLSQRIIEEEIDKVYSSDRKRAIQSAQIIFKELAIEKNPDLREINFGIFEGLTHKEIMQRHTFVYTKWLNDPFATTIPKGENLQRFRKRVVKIFKKIISINKNKTIAVVCHGGPISIFINHILKAKDFLKHIPHPASLSIIEYKNGQAKIRLFNDTAHLNKDLS